MQIDIFSDPVCPWCYIGKKRMARALDQRPDVTAQIRWRAFQLNPDMPPEGMDRQTYLSVKFGGAERAAEIYGHIDRVGKQAGIEFKFDRIPRAPNTLQAHRLIRFAARLQNGCSDAVVDGLFRAYFLEGRDIGHRDELLAIAEAAGLDRDAVSAYLDSDEDSGEIQAEDTFARRIGIGGVPCFIIGGKYALSGAQEPEAFLPIFDTVLQEERETQASTV